MGKGISDIDQEVDRILDAVAVGDNLPTNRRMKRSKHLIKASGLMVLLISAILVSGSLLVLFGMYTGEQSGDIDLTGVTSDLYFDGTPMSTETFSVPMDVTSMIAGESFEFEHSVESTGMPDWDLSFDTSAVTGFLPENPFFGFYFDILDVGEVSIIDDTILIRPDDPIVLFDFSYELDEMFLDVMEPLPYVVDVILTQHVDLAPICGDDYGTFVADGETDVDALSNDVDPEGGHLLITGVEQGVYHMDVAEVRGTYPDQYLYFQTCYGADVYYVEYYVEDDRGSTATGLVEIVVTAQ